MYMSSPISVKMRLCRYDDRLFTPIVKLHRFSVFQSRIREHDKGGKGRPRRGQQLVKNEFIFFLGIR